MSTKKSTAIVPAQAGANFQTFSQPYELKRLLEPVMQAGMLVKQNILLISKPGYGKSEIFDAMGRQVYGEGVIDDQDHTFVLPCMPSTLPPDVVGFQNPMYMIDPEAEAKRLEYWITKNTPVDRQVEYCILEEATRIGDLGGDALVHAMHSISKYHRPMYVANANWLTPTPRNEALRDRFSFTIFYQPSIVDVRALVHTPAIQTWSFDLPNYEQICQVREWENDFIRNPDGYACDDVISSLLEQIQRVCEGTDFEFNNRRVFQLRSMLYGMGCFYADSNDFTQLPKQAFEALMYAYPVVDFAQANMWKKIVYSVIDVVETQISEFKSNAYQAWQEIFSQHADRNGTISQAQRDGLSRKLATTWQSYEKTLQAEFPGDPRVGSALQEMFSIYRELIRGNNPLK